MSYQVLSPIVSRTQVYFPKRHSRSALRTTLTNNSNLHGKKSDAVFQMTSTSSRLPYGTLHMGSGNLSSISHPKMSEKVCTSTSRLRSPFLEMRSRYSRITTLILQMELEER